MDEFDVDEQGIFRDKPHHSGSSGNADQGILVDEEGVWRDVPNDNLSHLSYRTFHTDSGLGGDRTGKSSSATLNQFRSEYGSEEDYGTALPVAQGYVPFGLERDKAGVEEVAKESSSQIDSKSTTSYHISELENSESQQENLSFEQHSYDSEQALEFPELIDESYLFSEDSNARAVSGSHGNSLEHRGRSDSHGSSVDLDKYATSGAHYAEVFSDSRFQRQNHFSEGHSLDHQGHGATTAFRDQVDHYENRDYDYSSNQFSSHERISQDSRPESRGQGSRPASRGQGYRPDSRGQGSRPESRGQGSRPDSRSQSSRPESRGQGSRPESRGQSSRSESRGQGSEEEIRVLGVPQTVEEVVGAIMDSSEGEEISDIEGEDYDAFPPTNHVANNRRRHQENHSAPPPVSRHHRRSHRRHGPVGEPDSEADGKPPIVGDSIFTQEEFSNNRQSLAEFEQLEAALETNVSENEAADQMDLIGAYLKGLKQRDEEDSQEDEEIAYHSENQSRQAHPRDVLQPPTSGSKRGAISPSSPRIYDTAQNGYRHQQDSISMISGSVDEIMLEPDQDEQLREGDPDQLGALPTLADIDPMQSFGDSLPFEKSLEETALYYDYAQSDGVTPRNPELSLPRAQTPSRIPILRSGSPSRSRPGSRCASRGPRSRPTSRGPGSRPGSPDRKPLGPNQTGIPEPAPGVIKGPRRALPVTPQKRRVQEEAAASVKSPRPTADHSAPGTQMSQAESELGRAAHWLMMDDAELQNGMASAQGEEQDELRSLTSPSRSKSATPKQKHSMHSRDSSPHIKGPSPSDARLSTDDSAGEDLSQGSTASRRELKTRYIEEVHSRKQHEETLGQLEKEYQNLLKKYAEAENVIDDLRLGAKVKLYVETVHGGGVVPGNAGAGAQMSKTFPMAGTHGSMGTPTQMAHQAIVDSLQQAGVRPPSRASHSSMGIGGSEPSQNSNGSAGALPGMNGHTDAQTAMSNDDLESLQGDGVKLSLLVKAKAIEEQTNAFQILLDEKQLTLEDQSKALENIKANYEQLNQDYRNAKDEHDFRRRQGVLGDGSNEPAFDENKEVDGELYKINMKLDDLEHSVQENLKHKSARKPFSGGKPGPVKADHSLRGQADSRRPGAARGGGGGGGGGNLPDDRPPSLGSLTGGASVDQALHALQKEYSDLMDHYRRVKGASPTPERDQHLGTLLDSLKAVYERTPEHRRQPLPPELENQYNSTTGTFVPPLSLPDDEPARRPLHSRARHRTSDGEVTSDQDSEFAGDARAERGPRSAQRPPLNPHDHQRNQMGDQRNSVGNQRSNPGDQRTLPGNRRDRYNSASTAASDYGGRRRVYGTESESDAPLHNSARGRPGRQQPGTRKLPRPGTGPRSQRRDPANDNSAGAYGSPAGRRSTSGGRGVSSGSGAPGDRNFSTKANARAQGVTSHTSPRRTEEDEDYSDSASSSGSADSVIYNARVRSGSRENDFVDNREKEEHSGGLGSRSPRSDLRSRSRSRGRRQDASASEEYSDDKMSPRSDKLRNLTNEVERLKHQLQHGTTPIQSHGQQGSAASQIVPSLPINQAVQGTAVYGNPAVNQTQATPFGPQTTNQGIVPPVFNGGQISNQVQGPPMYANQPVNQVAPGQHVYAQQPFNQTMTMPIYADQAYVPPYNGYNEMYAPDQDYYDEYPEDEYDDYQDGYNSDPEYGRRHRSNSMDRGNGGRRGYSRDGQGYGRSPSRERPRNGSAHGRGDYDRRGAGYDSEGDLYAEDGADYASPSRSRGYQRYPNRDSAAHSRSGDRYERASRYGNPNGYGDADNRSRLSRSDYGKDKYNRRNRSQGRSGSRGRSGYYSDPDSPSRSPERRLGEMRRYFVPRRGAPARPGASPSRSRGASPVRSRGASPMRRMPSPIRAPPAAGMPANAYSAPIQGPYYAAQSSVNQPNLGQANINQPNLAQPGINQPNIGMTPGITAVGNVPMGNVPMGNGNVLMGSGNVPMGSGNVPMGSGNVPMGSGSIPMGNGYIPSGGMPGVNAPNVGVTAPNMSNGTSGYPQGHIDPNTYGVNQALQQAPNTTQPLYASHSAYPSSGSVGSVSTAPVPNGYHPGAGSNGYQPGVLSNSNYQHMGSANTYPNSGVVNGNSAHGGANGYQVTAQGHSCPMCGGAGQHTHGEYHFTPQGGSTSQTANSSGLVPVQIVPGSQRPPKVRYYVREFGGDSASEAEVVYRKTNRVKTYVLDDGSESERPGAMDDSLAQAIKTANKLKHMSTRMRESLNDEINRSIKEGSFLFAH